MVLRSTALGACAIGLLVSVGCGSEASGFETDGVEENEAPGGGNPGAGSSGATPGSSTPLPACVARPACDGTTAPPTGAARGFAHTMSQVTTTLGSANHRGRDQIVVAGDAQWIIGKFAYGVNDKDIHDEDVDIFVERGCAGSWEKLGTVKTTNDGQHASVLGVDDDGGRIFFEIPKAKELPLGRHRVRLFVAGDASTTDLIIEVVAKGTTLVVTDVDGTLTSSENAEYGALLTGSQPDVHVDAPKVLHALAGKGYVPVYVTARPEWLTGRTRELVTHHELPPGIVHPTAGLTGATGAAATTYKSATLERLVTHGLHIGWAFGNTDTDAAAYQNAKILPLTQRVFYQLTDANGGRRIESYTQVLPDVLAAPKVCE